MYQQKYHYILLFFLAILLVSLTACTIGKRAEPPASIPAQASSLQDRIATPTPSPPAKASLTPGATPPPASASAPVPDSPPLPARPGVPPAPLPTGKVIVVDLSHQWLYAYEDGTLVFDHAVETGRPELPTPTGTFRVLEKVRDVIFTSPWPQGSPHYYEPTHVNYAMLFKEGGFFLHDASWHVQFGPGSNVPHQLPDGSWETGSHGCVGMPLPDAERLYEWLPVGTPVVIW